LNFVKKSEFELTFAPFCCNLQDRRAIYATFSIGGRPMSTIQALENEIGLLKEEYEKFERGNKSAGTRARKILQNIKRLSQEIRVTIQTVKKTEDKPS